MSKRPKLAPKKVYQARVLKNVSYAALFIGISLGIGVLGYKWTIPQLDWYDSLLNASMILSGMGPMIDPSIQLTNTAKVFASVYALFSGITFIGCIGLIIAPIAHRFFHRLHLQDSDTDS
jgi:hypothetical protein